jgi:hypothetical protein
VIYNKRIYFQEILEVDFVERKHCLTFI